MKTISIHKAQKGVNEIEPAQIVIETEIPADHRMPEIFQHDAEQLANLLWSVLPGGTLDLLIATMLQKRAVTLIVPFTKFDKGGLR